MSSLNFVSYSCCKCHDGRTTDLLGSCHEAGKLASSTESRAHAVLSLDCVAVRARRSPTAEIDIVSSMDHHFTTTRRVNQALGEYLPQGGIDGRIQGALSAQPAGCMQPASRVHVEVAGTDGAP